MHGGGGEFVMLKGILVTVTSVVIFIGSIYIFLAAIFGPRMGYLVTAVGFFGLMVLLSLLWTFGSLAYLTPTALGTLPNLGPRGWQQDRLNAAPSQATGGEPHWIGVASGVGLDSSELTAVERYPGEPWAEPDRETQAQVAGVTVAVQELVALEACAQEHGREECEDMTHGELPFAPTSFIVEDVRFHEEEGRSYAMARATFIAGGPQVTVLAVFDEGNVSLPSWLFLIGSIVGLAIHLPFLDRAERRRKHILTGGTPPPFLGPA